MRADLRAEPVLERRDDATAVRVVLGVRRGQQHDVDGKPDLVTPDLHVALLEHVQQTHLDPLCEVGKLVDREDAAVGARDEPVVDGELVGEVAALGHLDGIDLADQVGDRGVGRGELLTEAPIAVDPLDRCLVAALGHEQPRVLRDRVVRVVVDLAAGDDRHPFVEQLGEPSDHAGLGLPALAEEDHVVAGDQRVLELRENGVLVADHAVDELLAFGDPRDRVARTSSLTGRETQPLVLSSPRVPGRVIEQLPHVVSWRATVSAARRTATGETAQKRPLVTIFTIPLVATSEARFRSRDEGGRRDFDRGRAAGRRRGGRAARWHGAPVPHPKPTGTSSSGSGSRPSARSGSWR